MIKLSTPHSHTPYCDGQSSPREMVEAALKLGFVSLGFSSHARQDFDLAYALDERGEQDYIRDIRALQQEYRGRIRLWLGMERDTLSTAQREPFDYVLASVHYTQMGGGRVAVDGPPELVAGCIREHFGGDGLAFAEDYYQTLGGYIRDYKPDIIGHFDLLTKHNVARRFFDTGHPRYIKAARRAMDEAITGCRLMEVNTGAIARSGASVPYPSLELLQYWRGIGGEVILSSDCHRTNQLNTNYEQGEALIRAAGYKKAAFLGRHEDLFEWCELA